MTEAPSAARVLAVLADPAFWRAVIADLRDPAEMLERNGGTGKLTIQLHLRECTLMGYDVGVEGCRRRGLTHQR